MSLKKFLEDEFDLQKAEEDLRNSDLNGNQDESLSLSMVKYTEGRKRMLINRNVFTHTMNQIGLEENGFHPKTTSNNEGRGTQNDNTISAEPTAKNEKVNLSKEKEPNQPQNV